eukprot:2986564-Prymnesium_polylepis.1
MRPASMRPASMRPASMHPGGSGSRVQHAVGVTGTAHRFGGALLPQEGNLEVGRRLDELPLVELELLAEHLELPTEARDGTRRHARQNARQNT